MYIQVTCNTCHAIFNVRRVQTGTWKQNGLVSCIECGSPSSDIRQLNQEETWSEVMALKYKRTPEQMDQLFAVYQQLQNSGSVMSFHTMVTGEP